MNPQRELTLRAVLTGTVLGGLLSLCNIYSGLRIGWGFNMSITAALLGWGFWSIATVGRPGARFTKLENNLNQTGASAGASISSAGLVSAIPAWTMMTGQTLSWPVLAFWLFAISMVGVIVGIGLRRQMLEVDRLPFASGIASAETLDKLHPEGANAGTSEAKHKLYALLGSLGLSGVWKLLMHVFSWSQLHIPGSFAAGTVATGAVRRASFFNLTFGIDVSPLMFAVGALGSLRTGVTMLLGSILAWGVIAPRVIAAGACDVGADDPDTAWFSQVVKWLLWPGVALMVSSSLTSVAFSWRSFIAAFTGKKVETAIEAEGEEKALVSLQPDVPRRVFWALLLVATVVSSLGQFFIFEIPIPMGIFATLLTFALATVAARVSGETTVTPIGAMGKVTQLIFGIVRPGDATANLMTANVTGGAAAHTADLLHDMKAGLLVGASPRAQVIAQTAGVLGGAVVGGAAYLILIPDPQSMLLTDEWPAPAVATWRAVAELFAHGADAMPIGTLEAMVIASIVGVTLAILEKVLPPRARIWVPSPASLGLAFVIQAWTSLSLFVGSVIGFCLRRWAPDWSERYLTPIASGIIAGESLMGVGIALQAILSH